jgi:hypothetical protein
LSSSGQFTPVVSIIFVPEVFETKGMSEWKILQCIPQHGAAIADGQSSF